MVTWGNLLREKRGSALVQGMGILLTLSLVTYCVYFFSTTLSVAAKARDEGRLMLDAYTIKQGKAVADSIKNGHDYTDRIDMDVFLKDYYTALGISSDFNAYQDGRLRFKLSGIRADYVVTSTLETSVRYTMSVPFYFMDRELFRQDIPIELQSRYHLKY